MSRVLSAGLVLATSASLAAQGGTGAASPSEPNTNVSTQRFEDYMRAHEREHELIALAITEARRTVDIRLEGMNELRAQINTERAHYATAESVETLRQRTDKIEQNQASAAGSAATWALVLGVFFTVLQIAMRFLIPMPRK